MLSGINAAGGPVGITGVRIVWGATAHVPAIRRWRDQPPALRTMYANAKKPLACPGRRRLARQGEAFTLAESLHMFKRGALVAHAAGVP